MNQLFNVAGISSDKNILKDVTNSGNSDVNDGCCWQLWYVDDRFTMLVTNSLSWKGANMTKNPQQNDSIININIRVVEQFICKDREVRKIFVDKNLIGVEKLHYHIFFPTSWYF